MYIGVMRYLIDIPLGLVCGAVAIVVLPDDVIWWKTVLLITFLVLFSFLTSANSKYFK